MKTIATAIALIALIALAGCQTYQVDVVIHAGGDGTRSIVLELDGRLDAESTPTLEQYRAYFGLDQSWDYDPGETKQAAAPGSIFDSQRIHSRFTHTASVDGIAGWAKLDGDVSVRGSLDKGPFGAVRFSNRISVRRGGREGARTLEYRETFLWTALRDALVRHQVRGFLDIVESAYPHLDAEQLAELRGIAASGFLIAIEMDLREVEDEDAEAVLNALEGFSREHFGLGPEPEGSDALRSAYRQALLDPNNRLEAFLKEKLPGVDQAILTDLELRVTLPGPIIETNAEAVEGNTAVWRIELFDALNAPVEAYAKAAAGS